MPLDTEFTQMSTEDQAAMAAMQAADNAPADDGPGNAGEAVTDPPALTEAETQAVSDGTPPPVPAQQPGTVPQSQHPALVEERERRKVAEQSLAEERRRFDERLSQVLQRIGVPQQQVAQQQVEIPPLDKDPIAHFQARLAQSEQIIAQLAQGTRQQQQQSTQQQVAQAVQLTAQAQENEYRSATPDYNDAAAFLRQSRHQELTDLGFTNAAEREALIAQEALQIAGRAIQQGRNFPGIIYKLAQGRGFKAGAAATPPATDSANGAQPQQQAPAAAERLQTAANGQQQARSISGARGTAAPTGMTAQRLLEMSPEQFGEWLDKTPLSVQMELMGN